jgi:hypothetical protein
MYRLKLVHRRDQVRNSPEADNPLRRILNPNRSKTTTMKKKKRRTSMGMLGRSSLMDRMRTRYESWMMRAISS